MTLRRHIRILTAQAAVAFGLAALYPSTVRSQTAEATAMLVKNLRAEIKTGEAAHADPGRVGDLWRRLGIAYQAQYDIAAAEDAYSHALPLLQAAGDQSGSADALHGLGSVYLSTRRGDEARKYFAASLAIYEKLHDATSAASLHQAIGMQLLFNGKFKPAIAEFSASLEELKDATREPEPLIAGYLMRGAAEYRAGDATQALADTAIARAAAAEFRLPANSFEMIAAALVEGAALTRLGRADEADAAIRQAMQRAATRTDLPQMMSTRIRIGILLEYSISLQAAHRKPDAKRIEAQAVKLQSTLPGTCAGCTISVAALQASALSLPGLP